MNLFVNYAHRGASEYAPENTMMAFQLAMFMGANGIETDVQLTKDGVPVLFHDDKLARVTGEAGCISDYTLDELQEFRVRKDELEDRIPTLEAFLAGFGWRDITFAIELKQQGTARPAAELVRRYGIADKVVFTSFIWEEICALREYAPEMETGFLTDTDDDALMERMRRAGIMEFCPKAVHITKEMVDAWHAAGFRVRAWGVKNEDLMRRAYVAGVDGMTVNFPDKLTALIRNGN